MDGLTHTWNVLDTQEGKITVNILTVFCILFCCVCCRCDARSTIIQWSIASVSTFTGAHNRLHVITVGFCLHKTSRLFVLDVSFQGAAVFLVKRTNNSVSCWWMDSNKIRHGALLWVTSLPAYSTRFKRRRKSEANGCCHYFLCNYKNAGLKNILQYTKGYKR